MTNGGHRATHALPSGTVLSLRWFRFFSKPPRLTPWVWCSLEGFFTIAPGGAGTRRGAVTHYVHAFFTPPTVFVSFS